MSCDFNSRDELRAALLRSTTLLRELIPLFKGQLWEVTIGQQLTENKQVLKAEAANRLRLANPETCPPHGVGNTLPEIMERVSEFIPEPKEEG